MFSTTCITLWSFLFQAWKAFLMYKKFAIYIISHINYWDELNSWKNFWRFWNGPLCRNKSGPSPLLNVVVYWQSSKAETCAKKLSQILANKIDNGGAGLVSKFMRGIVVPKICHLFGKTLIKLSSLCAFKKAIKLAWIIPSHGLWITAYTMC